MADDVTRAKIIEMATTLFKSQGCKRITMNHLANELHISKRTLYENFEAKEDLLIGCYNHLLAIADERRRIFEEESPAPVITALYIFKGIAHFYKHYSLMIEDTRRYYPEIYSKIIPHQEGKWAEKVTTTLLEAERQGYIRPNADLQSATEVMVHFLNRALRGEANGPSLATLGEAGFTFMRGLLAVDVIEKYDVEEQRIKQQLVFDN